MGADEGQCVTLTGDDNTDDGRDLANRPSEDRRKSRMGYIVDFSDSDFYGDEVTNLPSPPPHLRFLGLYDSYGGVGGLVGTDDGGVGGLMGTDSGVVGGLMAD
ncbi:hypothetical protein CTI12_AA548770 [Artemisia annua]|uniref:Uncharacterized protein n=1 Tax=Artemisia annua TaxID=35608 RepID=A0A2U1KYZ7_ARTAN|nr:hypothetical protein CTI12_AA548770 [Artemisia annua]